MRKFWKWKWRVYRRHLAGWRLCRGGLIRHRSDMSIKYVLVKFRIFGRPVWL